jgi:hypothetical protein
MIMYMWASLRASLRKDGQHLVLRDKNDRLASVLALLDIVNGLTGSVESAVYVFQVAVTPSAWAS